MRWLKNLFKGNDENEYTGTSDVAARTAEIKARIAAIRSRNGWDEEPYRDTKVRSKSVVEEKALPVNNKNVEMDALKAKLLGKAK
jgi:hypothetical protein